MVMVINDANITKQTARKINYSESSAIDIGGVIFGKRRQKTIFTAGADTLSGAAAGSFTRTDT
jgi:hypothetical protein